MRRVDNVMYDAIPETVTVYETSVVVVTSCIEVEVQDEMSGSTSTKYQCTIEIYEPSEYILLKQENSATWDELAAALQEGVDSV